MRRATLLACLACLTAPALAETALPGGPPLDARAFDALGSRLQALAGGVAEPSNVVALDAVRAA